MKEQEGLDVIDRKVLVLPEMKDINYPLGVYVEGGYSGQFAFEKGTVKL